MRAIKKILAAVDDSPRAAGVLQMARELADRFGAAVHLFTVVGIPLPYPPAAHAQPDDLSDVLREDATQRLRDLVDDHAGTTTEPPVVTGLEPWRVILEKARQLDVDLIVIGSHTIAGWDRLLRTNAARIAEQADRHVFVVHEQSA